MIHGYYIFNRTTNSLLDEALCVCVCVNKFPENNCPFVTAVACRTLAEYKCNGLTILCESALPCPPCLGVCAFTGLQDPTCYSCAPECHPPAHTTNPNPLTRGRICFKFIMGIKCETGLQTYLEWVMANWH